MKKKTKKLAWTIIVIITSIALLATSILPAISYFLE